MNLLFKEYQERTADTAIYGKQIEGILGHLGLTEEQSRPIMTLLRISYVSNGLGEAGEVQGKIKKVIRDSGGIIDPERRRQLAGELGDVLWYLSQMASELDLSLDEIAQANLSKLAARKERGTLQGSGDER